MEMRKATGVSEGIGIGRVVVVDTIMTDTAKRRGQSDIEKERLANAAEKLTANLEKKAASASEEQAGILESHIMLLGDPFIISGIEEVIDKESCNSEYAVAQVMENYINMFRESGDELLAARSVDLKDIQDNLLMLLAGVTPFDPGSIARGSVLVADELTTSVAAGISPELISAIVTRTGGRTSHTAIIARSLGIPAVSGADIVGIEDSDLLIVDGTGGCVVWQPTDEQLEEYEAKREAHIERKKALEAYRGMESVTLDGRRIELCANIGLEADIVAAIESDSEGVGLFRTEFLYMDRPTIPKEEEQFSVYKKAAVAFGQKPVIIRTLDIGGDKAIPALGLDKEDNPFLGWRAIRYCLDRQDVFRIQLRAILRASAFGNIKIMIPMLSGVEELKSSAALIEEVKAELRGEGTDFNEHINVGIMVETPSAAIMADKLAGTADFFSIGTNDLTQYTLAVDRGNEKVSNLYTTYSPAILRLIYSVAQAASEAGIMCGICGEAGGDPRMVRFLIGCGLSELSMTGSSILRARQIVRESAYEELRDRVERELWSLGSVREAEAFLDSLDSE